MTKQIEVVYENGVFRPMHPINIPEGEHLQLIVITRKETQHKGNAAAALAKIAALPIEGEDATPGSWSTAF